MTDSDTNADTTDDYEEIRAGIEEHNRRVREALAEDLGGDPEDYDPRARTDVNSDADPDTAESD